MHWAGRLRDIVVLIGSIALLAIRAIASAQDASGAIALITAPTDGQQLFGLVTITGTAQYPAAFGSFTLEYNDLADPNAPWLLVQPPLRQQLANDVLGLWNTVVVPDGVYRLRLRILAQDGQTAAEYVVTGLRVINSEPTPVPTAITGAEERPPTPGPSPTSPIQQPPSNNPAGGAISGLDSTPRPASSSSAIRTSSTTTRINTGRIRDAFCAGIYLTFAAFALMLAYIAVRNRLRPYTRRLFWRIQDELQDDR